MTEFLGVCLYLQRLVVLRIATWLCIGSGPIKDRIVLFELWSPPAIGFFFKFKRDGVSRGKPGPTTMMLFFITLRRLCSFFLKLGARYIVVSFS